MNNNEQDKNENNKEETLIEEKNHIEEESDDDTKNQEKVEDQHQSDSELTEEKIENKDKQQNEKEQEAAAEVSPDKSEKEESDDDTKNQGKTYTKKKESAPKEKPYKKSYTNYNKKSSRNYNKNKSNNYNKDGYKNYRTLINQALKIPIIQVASKLGLPITQQKTTKCINPSHFDKNSSMSFNEKTNKYECFFCGASGTTIDMVKSILRVTRNKAAEWIMDKVENTEEYKKFIPEDRKKNIITGSSIENKSPTSTYKEKPIKEHLKVNKRQHHHEEDKSKIKLYEDRSKLIKSGEMQKMYRKITNSLTPLSRIMIGIGFIKDKQISTDTTDSLGIGILLNTDEVMKDFKKKYSMDQLYAAGLFRKPDGNGNNEAAFTFKEHSVIFPYISGRMIVYLQGRRLDNKEPIYTTSTKGQPFIYNYNILRNINEKQTLIICTDIVEAICLIDKGFNVINVVNAHRFKNDWTKNIPSKKIILSSDDNSIQRRIGSIFLKSGVNIRISNYDKIGSTSKKKLDTIGESFRKGKQHKGGDVPFWKNSE